MTPDDKYGRTTAAPVRVLESMVIDFSAGNPLPPGLGNTDTPVRVLPIVEWEVRPVLNLTLWVNPEAGKAELATDLFRAWQALDDLDRSQQGAGLAAGRVS